MKNKLSNKKTIYGTWQEIPSSYTTSIISNSGLDFIIADFEHGILNIESLQNMIFASNKNNCSIIARISEYEQSKILPILDTGVDGIMIPHIEKVEDLNKFIEKILFYPEGRRGFNPFLNDFGFKGTNKSGIEQKNKDLVISIIIESLKGFENLESIVNNKYLDMIYLGQYDLSIELGIPGDINNPELNEILKKAIKIINKNNISAGCMVHSIEDAKKALEIGYSTILFGIDTGHVYNIYNSFINGVKQL